MLIVLAPSPHHLLRDEEPGDAKGGRADEEERGLEQAKPKEQEQDAEDD
jgi:hypothetical protein